jgi:DNA-binding transcriptional regulator YiaG
MTSLREFIDKYELTIDDTAILLGRTKRTVYNWLDNTYEMPASARLLIRALDEGIIPFDWIIKEIEAERASNQ